MAADKIEMYYFSDICNLDYEYRENKYCNGGDLGRFSTLGLAKSACSDNAACSSITDFGCDGDEWVTCIGNGLVVSSEGSCSWLKLSKLCAFKNLHSGLTNTILSECKCIQCLFIFSPFKVTSCQI